MEGEVWGAGAPKPGMVAGAGPRFDLPRRFAAALNNDLDMPGAIRELRAAVRRRDAASVRQMLPILAGTASLR